MARAIVVHELGGPEQLRFEEVDVPAPGPGQIKLKSHAIGLNFIDVYQRTGLYKVALPFVAGNEGAGEVIAVGPDVTTFKPGDRVAYQGAVGAYAEERLLPVERAVRIPDGISYEVAAAAILKGLTAFYLLHWTHPLKAGETKTVEIPVDARSFAFYDPEKRAFVSVPYVNLGQYVQPIAFRANVEGVLEAGVPVYWNIEKR